MDIFEFALQMEKDGEDYYRLLARQTENTGLKTIFNMLAEDELKHYHAIQQVRSETAQLAETSILADAKNIFAQLKESKENINFDIEQSDLYKQAQAIEKKSMDFYLEKSQLVNQDYQKQLFLNLAEEEKKHYFMLENIVEFISRPETWLEDAEFNHLDEY